MATMTFGSTGSHDLDVAGNIFNAEDGTQTFAWLRANEGAAISASDTGHYYCGFDTIADPNDWATMSRGYISINTSALSGKTITAASLYLKSRRFNDWVNSSFTVGFYKWYPDSAGSLSTNDWLDFSITGTTGPDFTTAYSATTQAIPAGTDPAETLATLEVVLNATALTAIGNGRLSLCMAYTADATNTEPAPYENGVETYYDQITDYAYMVVTYTGWTFNGAECDVEFNGVSFDSEYNGVSV